MPTRLTLQFLALDKYSMAKGTRIRSLCSLCSKLVGASSKAICCDFCLKWTHVQCDGAVPEALYDALRAAPAAPLLYPCPTCRQSSAAIPLVGVPVKTQDADAQTTSPTRTPVLSSFTTADCAQPSAKSPPPSTVAVQSFSDAPLETSTNLPAKPSTAIPANPWRSLADSAPAFVAGKESERTILNSPKPGLLSGRPTQTRPTMNHSSTRAGASQNSVVLMNVPECLSERLDVREREQNQFWENLTKELRLASLRAVRSVRIGPRTDSQQPRPLRVELDSAQAAEDLLLSSSALRLSTMKDIRIYPDVPWSEREARRQAIKSTPPKELSRRRSVILRGIPESPLEEPLAQLEHDRAQWAFIKSKLFTNPCNIRVAYMRRLPRPVHLSSLHAPHLLRITLANEAMVTDVLEAWYQVRRNFPSEIRLHRDMPRDDRRASPTTVTQPVVSCERLPTEPLTTGADAPATPTSQGNSDQKNGLKTVS